MTKSINPTLRARFTLQVERAVYMHDLATFRLLDTVSAQLASAISVAHDFSDSDLAWFRSPIGAL